MKRPNPFEALFVGRLTAYAWLALPLFALTGCTEPDFDKKEIIKDWRVLGIVAEPPEISPGEEVELSALVVTPDAQVVLDPMSEGVEFRWSACAVSEEFGGLRGTQYNPEVDAAGCGNGEGGLAIELPTSGNRAQLPALATDFGEVALEDLGSDALNFLPPETLELLVTEVGFPLTVQLEILDENGEVFLSAIKRVLLSLKDRKGTNPPQPEMAVGPTNVVYRDSFECEPDGAALEFDSRKKVRIRPALGNEWIEQYKTLDITGEIVDTDERPFYSWFATGGSFDESVTKDPEVEVKWTTPTEPGNHAVFVVVRDGHGGTSACRVAVTVR